jgi:hypothetical protein
MRFHKRKNASVTLRTACVCGRVSCARVVSTCVRSGGCSDLGFAEPLLTNPIAWAAKLVSAELQAQTDFTLPKEVTDAANKAVLELAPDEKKIYSECMWQIKNDALSCECGVRINNDPAAYLKCDCKNFDFPEWKLLAFAILGAGIMCILIAICGCGASFKAAPVALYSVCSGLFTLIFLVIGVMLVGIGMVVSGSLNDAVPKEERGKLPFALFKKDQCLIYIRNQLQTSFSGSPLDPTECLTDAACVTAKYLFDKAVVFLYGLG